MRNALEDHEKDGISIGGRSLTNLRYADDTTLLAGTRSGSEQLLQSVSTFSKETGLYLNIDKTNEMRLNGDDQREITVDGTGVKRIECFNFLGTMLNVNGDCKQEISRRLAVAQKAATTLNKIWKNKGTTLHTKIRLMNSLVFSIARYGSETWTLRKAERNKIEAFEMKMW